MPEYSTSSIRWVKRLSPNFVSTFSNVFYRVKVLVLWFKFHWILFLRVQLTISRYWFWQWFGTKQVPNHYLNQCWPCSMAPYGITQPQWVNSLRPRQNGRFFADDTFKRIFLNENIRISTKNSLKFVPKGFINNIPALVLIMAWRRPGDKPLSEPMLVRSLMRICITQPQWVN